MSQPKPEPHQKLWVVRWGTMSQMVWAGSAEWAERKVRTGVVRTLARPAEIESSAVLIRGPVFVKEATATDLAEWQEAGGRPIEHVG